MNAQSGYGANAGFATANATGAAGTVTLNAFANAESGSDTVGAATSTVTGTALGGSLQAFADMLYKGAGPITEMTAKANTPVAGATTALASAGFGGAASFGTSYNAISAVVGMPTGAPGGTGFTLGTTDLFDWTAGGSEPAGTTALSSYSSSTLSVTLNLADLSLTGDLELYLNQAVLVGSGVTAVSFLADVEGSNAQINEYFTNVAQAHAYFTHNLIDFGPIDALTSSTTSLTISLSLYVVGDPPGAGLFSELAVGGTLACFLPGTLIRTDDGETPVEQLKLGDLVRVHQGGTAPVIWIGHREIDTATHNDPANVMPILIAAGAFSTGVPSRDLLVSPDHAMYFDGHLIPARSLTNGFTIRQVSRPRVKYFHIELETHSLVWAEGALTESFLECGNRSAFENGGPVRQLFPAFNGIDYQAMRIARSCAPFADNGPVVHEVRRRLLLQARIPMTRDHGTIVEFVGDRAIIRSRVAVPGHTELDPGDKRSLGVKIGTLSVDGRSIPLDHPLLTEGWHAAEPDGRWTNGQAVVPAQLLGGSRNVKPTLAWTTLYPMQENAATNLPARKPRRKRAAAAA